MQLATREVLRGAPIQVKSFSLTFMGQGRQLSREQVNSVHKCLSSGILYSDSYHAEKDALTYPSAGSDATEYGKKMG